MGNVVQLGEHPVVNIFFSKTDLWLQLPDNAPCQLHAPSPTFSQKEQQQAVVWMAQDVYTALLKQSVNLMDQLEIVAVWRDITSDIGDDRGVASIHDFLIKALGEEGPLMLGQISP